MTFPNSRHAHVVGLGLIGSSVALALRSQQWHVTGTDLDASIVDAALAAGVVDDGDPHDDHHARRDRDARERRRQNRADVPDKLSRIPT